jgi:hypothetical protein
MVKTGFCFHGGSMVRTLRCHRLVAIVFFGLAFQLNAVSVSAELSLRLSSAQLADQSDLIVIGRATLSSSRWIDRTLVTAVTIEITESLKGRADGPIEVILPGGVDANRKVPVAMAFPGAPQMQNDERVFLFLTYDADIAGYIVAGFAQGKYSIVTQQGRDMISRDLRGSQLVEGTGISRGTVTLTPLADFKEEIAGYIHR